MAATGSVSTAPPPEPETSCQSPNASLSPCTSPPPNCPICLGPCTNKCFPDKCMHQFCFSCLLEWSKVKAECPLCKQPFKSIKHLVPTNNEYEEHVVRQQENSSQETLDLLFGELEDPFIDHLTLPNGPPPPQRQFQFRTTFTVDPRGEWAIQQMLLSHAVPQYILNPTRYLRSRRRGLRATSVTHFRRAIYQHNWWVSPSTDVTGRYRECSPEFYRDNPAQRNRLVPWLNRELNALLHENTRSVMHVVDIIMQNLLAHHILSRQFRSILIQHFQDKTDHFIHEFYSFMRSPYDMIGYDNHIRYEHHRHIPEIVPIEVVSDDDDSDVTVDDAANGGGRNPLPRPIPLSSMTTSSEVIEINTTSDSDNSDVIIREPTPPPVVDLLNTDTDSEGARAATGAYPWSQDAAAVAASNGNAASHNAANSRAAADSSAEDNKKPIVLPLKVRLKYHRRPKRKTASSSSISSSSSSSSLSSSSSSSSLTSSLCSTSESIRERKKYRWFDHAPPPRPNRPQLLTEKQRHRCRKALKRQRARSSSSSLSPPSARRTTSTTSSSEDDEPLSNLKCKLKEPKKEDSSSVKRKDTPLKRKRRTRGQRTSTHRSTTNNSNNNSSSKHSDHSYRAASVPPPPPPNEPGPSKEAAPRPGRLRSVILKKENSNLWFARPCRSQSSDSGTN